MFSVMRRRRVAVGFAVFALLLLPGMPAHGAGWELTDPILRQSAWDTLWGTIPMITPAQWAARTAIRIPWGFGVFVGVAVLAVWALSKAYQKLATLNDQSHNLLDYRGSGLFFKVLDEADSGCGTADKVRFDWMPNGTMWMEGTIWGAQNLFKNTTYCVSGAMIKAAYDKWRQINSISAGNQWPGTSENVPPTLDEAIADARFPTIVPQLNENLRQGIREDVGTPFPPAGGLQYGQAGVQADPEPPYPIVPQPQPSPGVLPSPGVQPSPHPNPSPLPTPAPGDRDAPLSNGVLQDTIKWLRDELKAMFDTLGSTIKEQIGWLATVITSGFTWLASTVSAQLTWMVQQLQMMLTNIETRLIAIQAAIEALPDTVKEAVKEALEEAFVPAPETLTQFEQLREKVLLKPPLSMLPPTSLFPDPGAGACVIPDTQQVGIGLAQGMVYIHWPGFVCTLAGYVRTFFVAFLWVAIGWFVVTKVFPQVHI